MIENPTPSDHLAIITRAMMQSGLSWAFIDERWDAYVAAFDNFDVEKVAAYGDADVNRLMTTAGVIHSRPKIAGTIRNARALLDLIREQGSIRAYQDSFPDYAAARNDAKKRFAYMGDLNVYYWRVLTGASVPDVEHWMHGQDRDHPRIRELVRARTDRQQ